MRNPTAETDGMQDLAVGVEEEPQISETAVRILYDVGKTIHLPRALRLAYHRQSLIEIGLFDSLSAVAAAGG